MSSDDLSDLRTLTIQKLADVLDIQVWRVREMIAKGKAPPYFMLGRTYRFPIVGIRKWQEEITNNHKEQQ